MVEISPTSHTSSNSLSLFPSSPSTLSSLSCSQFKMSSLSSESIPTLLHLCINKIINILESTHFHPQQINELCKILSNCQHILDPILVQLLHKKVITDVALIAFLVPERHQLVCPEVNSIKNSTFKMIGYNCPNLVSDNLEYFSLLLSAEDLES